MTRRVNARLRPLPAQPLALHRAAMRRPLTQQRQCSPPIHHASSLLQLIWLASPALPIGGFSYSEGLEVQVEYAQGATDFVVSDWLVDQLHLSLARADLAVLAKAVPAWRRGDGARIAELNDWILHSRETSELRLQTVQMGRSFVEWLKSVRPQVLEKHNDLLTAGLTYPLAFALAASHTEASVRDTALSFAFAWAENMVAAAVKTVPLGQSAGQRILLRLADAIPAAVDHAMRLMDSERQAFCPMLAIRSAQHETQYSRLFRS